MYFACSVALLTYLLPAKAFYEEVSDYFSSEHKAEVSQFLVERNFSMFEESIRKLFGSPGGNHLKLTPSYEEALHEVLMSQARNYVILGGVMCDHVMIPQCSCAEDYASGFLLEYRILKEVKYAKPVELKLKRSAEIALAKIKDNNYALFLKSFHHIKRVYKIGLAFFNKTSTALVYEVEDVN